MLYPKAGKGRSGNGYKRKKILLTKV